VKCIVILSTEIAKQVAIFMNWFKKAQLFTFCSDFGGW